MAPTACLVVNVMLVAAAIVWQLRWGHLSTGLLTLLPLLPFWHTGLFGPLALLAHWPCWPTGLVGPLALLARRR
jgi:hypothetical protein